MEYRSFVSLSIAIIGNSRLGEALTTAFTACGHIVYRAGTLSEKTGILTESDECEGVHYCSIEDAAASADFIMIATSAQDVREVAYWLGDVRRKVIIDLTVNVSESAKDAVNTVGAIKAITGSEHIVKVLSLYKHEEKFTPLFGGQKVQGVLIGDSLKAKEIMKIISRELNVTEFYDFGGSENMGLFDQLCTCCRSMISPTYKSKVLVTVGNK